MNVDAQKHKLSPKDFSTDQEVRWCPGCGDYAILRAVQIALADIGARTENTVFVSGIGCASRFPYYISTYGFHSIHGRAPAFATGMKLANPELDVWVISGDGDALSIGGNHLIHLVRRNVDVQFLLFNNEIYGLTKGQYSPTSRVGTHSPSTPMGSIERAISPLAIALGAGARFIARGIDSQQKVLPEIFKRAHAHKGMSFVEILQNCIVYNDGVFSNITDKEVAVDRQILLQHGKPLIYGKDSKKGLRVRSKNLQLEEVTIGENGINKDDILEHDETNRMIAGLLVALADEGGPSPVGVLYCDPAPNYEVQVNEIVGSPTDRGAAGFDALLRAGHTWTVKE